MCVRMNRVRHRVSVCTCGQSLESFRCVYMWTEFGIVLVCERVH